MHPALRRALSSDHKGEMLQDREQTGGGEDDSVYARRASVVLAELKQVGTLVWVAMPAPFSSKLV